LEADEGRKEGVVIAAREGRRTVQSLGNWRFNHLQERPNPGPEGTLA
jgi:hypothetical protein